ncbi:electron transfer flavoprotein subunit alpha/FixB family protein [Trinickia sp. LjRoot230]|uniref:electron transfer flavoprotein subunit alpha/FixB family protein n=1 Tax=Trinickia sp. LjRoot230 TaxID=3342288 RepID=UPI003ECE5D9D
MNAIKRIDPRRPYVIASSGLRRITLGAEGLVPGAMFDTTSHPLVGHDVAPAKPRRRIDKIERVLLVAAHSDRGALDEHARQALAAAAIVADARTEVALVVFGELNEDAAALGADKLIEWRSLGRPAFLPDQTLAALMRCVEVLMPAHIVMPDNATGDGDLGRRYAARMRASVAANVVEIDANTVGVYVAAGRQFATRAWPDVILLAPDAASARLPFVGAGERLPLPPTESSKYGESLHTAGAYRDLGTTQLGAAEVALEEADFIVSAGNGVTDIAAFEQLAHTFGAAIGASRVAVDNGHFPRDKQIGATGKTVSASVYIAFGISGAVQHLQGIKDCRHVIAVNLDASAPIAKRANLTIVGDAQATMTALGTAIESARASSASGFQMPAQKPVTNEGVAA